jgi:hypothetical protein
MSCRLCRGTGSTAEPFAHLRAGLAGAPHLFRPERTNGRVNGDDGGVRTSPPILGLLAESLPGRPAGMSDRHVQLTHIQFSNPSTHVSCGYQLCFRFDPERPTRPLPDELPLLTVRQPASADRTTWSRAFSTRRHASPAEPLTLRHLAFPRGPVGPLVPVWPRSIPPTPP